MTLSVGLSEPTNNQGLQSLQSLQSLQTQRFRFRFRLWSSDLQSDGDLDSIRNSCDVSLKIVTINQQVRVYPAEAVMAADR